MDAFAPVPALIGGLLIGLASAILWLGNGRIAGQGSGQNGAVSLDVEQVEPRLALGIGEGGEVWSVAR